jgi:carboxypeptidase family protein
MKGTLRRVSALLILAPNLFAQFGSGIQGTIVDNSGAMIPGAQVVVTNLNTGVTRDVFTSDEGIYRVLSLGAGKYSVKATKQGFAPAAQPSVEVAANEIRKVDLEMKVSGVAETVNVSAQGEALETEQGRISSQITGTQLKALPIPNRNIINLMVLQPGVSGRNLGNEQLGSDATPPFNANGNRADGNSYTLDDSNINSISRGGRAEVTPNVETVAEVRVTTNNFSAEQGRNMGAQISIVTKSGTNQFHGSVWEYHTNNVLQNRNIFDTTSGVPVNRRNQFGFGVGGPIIRNKTFFYASYEGVRRSGATTQTATVETPQLRAWVLENRPNSLAAYFMRTFHPVADPTNNIRDLGGPLAGVNRFSSRQDGIPDLGTVQFLTSSDSRSNQYTIRVDHELRPGKDRLYGYFYRLNASTITPGIRPDFLRPAPTWGLFGNLVYSKTISASALNEVRLSATRFNGHYCAPKDPANPVGGGLSCPDMLNKQVPGINITGLGTVRDVNVFPGGFFPTEYQLKDTFTIIRGSHALKFGGELRRAINILWHTSSYVPVYTFASILDFIDDEPMQMTRTVDPRTGTPTTTRADMLIWEGAGFIQDDWKVRRNLTLNVGLRYDYFGPYSDTHDRFRNFVPGTGSYLDQLANGKVDITARGWDRDTLNFAPRFGFAWDIGAKGKNVIRGGYGLSYDRMATVQTATYRTNPPLAATATLGQNFGTTFTYAFGDPDKQFYGYPIDPGLKLGLDSRNGIAGARVAIAAIDPAFNNPYGQNWFLGMQRALPGQLVAEISWIGSAGHHLVNISNVNRYNGDMLDNRFDGFNPSFSSINMARTTSNSIYHGGTFAMRRGFSQGMTFQASYTFGKVLTDAEAEQAITSYYDANSRNLDRSVASFDVRQRVAFSGVWELPFLRRCGSLICRVARGWQFSGYGILESGLPLNVFTSAPYPNGDYNADGTNADRPNAPADSISRTGFSQQEFLTGVFAVSDFPRPAPGTNGTLGRNTFRGPGFARVDLSMEKGLKFTERVTGTLRIESYNAFNRVNLNSPSTDLTSNNFGRVTSAAMGRMYTVSMRLRF